MDGTVDVVGNEVDEPKIVVEIATVVVAGAVITGVLLLMAVGCPPFKHVQALEILAGTLDHCAANAGTV